jgi:tape measure domain-containing protein
MAGFGKGQIQGMYSDLLTSTRAIGATPQQTQGALLALEQMISKGVVSMEELRRQLGNALPGAFEIGAKAMNMNTAEFNKFVIEGKMDSTVFVPRFIKALKKEFGGGFKEATKSLDFALINLETRWQMLQRTLFKGQLGEGITSFINALSKLISNGFIVSTLRTIGNLLGVILKLVSALLSQINLIMVLLSPFVLMGIWSGLKNIGKAIEFIGKGALFLKKAFSPVYFTILGIIALLLILQDLIYGLFLRDKVFKSITGDILSGNDAQQPEETQTSPLASFSMNRRAKERARLMKDFNAKQPQMYSSPRGISGMLEKIENKTVNISLGDVNVKGANSPQETAMAVREELVALFTGEKLRNGAMEWQPIA